ncbi:hypothetical protein AB1Y20_007043 [Prymnesium parvum]|uniref:Acid ceramidase N-terminal domain-containing protein n=1 Tax=Prymnesium parvum TaxID=97485 RepID=A0AB34J2I7_PRYPA
MPKRRRASAAPGPPTPATRPRPSSEPGAPHGRGYQSSDAIPRFVLDLDQPCDERWQAVAHAFRPTFQRLVARNKDLLEAVRANAVASAPPPPACPPGYLQEVHALAALLRQPAALLWSLQLSYEAFALTQLPGDACGCTSAAVDCDDGVVHARTLDWAWLDGMDSLLVDLDVRRRGELLYRCTSVVGFVGVLTGMRAGGSSPGGGVGGFSLSLNYRRPFSGAWEDGWPALELPPPRKNPFIAASKRHAARGAIPVALALRLALETCSSYESACSMLLSTPLLAPCYILAAGGRPGEAVLLTCGLGTARTEQHIVPGGVLCVTNLDPSPEETPSLPEPTCGTFGSVEAKDFIQGESLLRRDMMLKILRRARASAMRGASSSAAALGFTACANAMATSPISNSSTLHTTIMCPALEVFVSQRSDGPKKFESHGFAADTALCETCFRCDRRVACIDVNSASAVESGPGSLLRRRGGAYYCWTHLPLRQKDLSFRA